MVLLTATPGIISAIKALPLTAREELSLAETPSLNDPISHEQLISIARRLSSHPSRSTNTGEEDDAAETVDSPTCEGSKYTLNSLLRGAKLYIPPPPPKPAPVSDFHIIFCLILLFNRPALEPRIPCLESEAVGRSRTKPIQFPPPSSLPIRIETSACCDICFPFKPDTQWS